MPTGQPIRIDDALQGEVPPARTSVGYVIALAAAAITLPSLILAYVGLIALVGYAMYWHAVNDLSWFSSASHSTTVLRPKALFLLALAYGAPLVAGAVTVFFMLKPFFARRIQEGWPVPLDPRGQRVFFALVGRIAALLGAPTPAAIEIDAAPNASARLESVFSNRLILRVGMPLVLGLSARQLLGVVAHELGHFRQGAGMRLSNVVRRTIHWLMGAVYARDEWDEALNEASQSESSWIAILAHVARLAVWLSRRVLWLLAHVGMLVASALVRQMEYDADRAEAAIAGTSEFAETMQAFQRITVGAARARARLAEGVRTKQLPDDIPALIAAESLRLDARVLAQVAKSASGSGFSLFDSHPSDVARVAAVQRLAPRYSAQGVIRVDAAATALFADLEGLCKVVTVAEYRERLGTRLDNMQLHPTETLTKRGAVDDEMGRTIERYLGAPQHPQRSVPFRASHLVPPSDLERATAELLALRTRQRAAARIARQSLDEFHAARGRVLAALRGKSLLAAGFSFKRATFGFEPNDAAVAMALERATAEEEFVASRLEEFEQLSAERLAAALALGLHDGVRRSLKKGDNVAAIATRLPPALVTLADAHEAILTMHAAWCRMEALLERAMGGARSARVTEAITAAARDVHQHLVRVRHALQTEPNPFDGADGTATLGDVVVGVVPPPTDVGGVIRCVHETLTRATDLRVRVFGRLALAAETVERAVLPEARESRTHDSE